MRLWSCHQPSSVSVSGSKSGASFPATAVISLSSSSVSPGSSPRANGPDDLRPAPGREPERRIIFDAGTLPSPVRSAKGRRPRLAPCRLVVQARCVDVGVVARLEGVHLAGQLVEAPLHALCGVEAAGGLPLSAACPPARSGCGRSERPSTTSSLRGWRHEGRSEPIGGLRARRVRPRDPVLDARA